MSSFYAVLGVSEKATQDEIRRSYRRKALATHPCVALRR